MSKEKNPSCLRQFQPGMVVIKGIASSFVKLAEDDPAHMKIHGAVVLWEFVKYAQEIAICTCNGDADAGMAMLSQCVNTTNKFALETVKRVTSRKKK